MNLRTLPSGPGESPKAGFIIIAEQLLGGFAALMLIYGFRFWMMRRRANPAITSLPFKEVIRQDQTATSA